MTLTTSVAAELELLAASLTPAMLLDTSLRAGGGLLHVAGDLHGRRVLFFDGIGDAHDNRSDPLDVAAS